MDFDWQKILNSSTTQNLINGAVNSAFPSNKAAVSAAPIQILMPSTAPAAEKSMDMKTMAVWGGLVIAGLVGIFLVFRKK